MASGTQDNCNQQHHLWKSFYLHIVGLSLLYLNRFRSDVIPSGNAAFHTLNTIGC
jgi:hypothetical protein